MDLKHNRPRPVRRCIKSLRGYIPRPLGRLSFCIASAMLYCLKIRRCLLRGHSFPAGGETAKINDPAASSGVLVEFRTARAVDQHNQHGSIGRLSLGSSHRPLSYLRSHAHQQCWQNIRRAKIRRPKVSSLLVGTVLRSLVQSSSRSWSLLS